MCDYSLMMTPNRLAQEGEELVAHRLKSGSVGLVARPDMNQWHVRHRSSMWQRIVDFFAFHDEPQPVVCVPPGARMLLHNFGPCETATFTQVSPDNNRHRDALLFDDGTTVMLQLLAEGQRITLVRLSSSEDAERLGVEELGFEPAVRG